MIKKILFLFILPFNIIGQNYDTLKVIADLPSDLNEVSGIELVEKSKYYWMINDGGNKPKLFGLSEKGKIKKEIDLDAKNHDWEDLTSDSEGNIYIGDFGNNKSSRQNLQILKVERKYLSKKKARVSKIKFTYEDQKLFPPKKDHLFYDAEAFFYFKNNLYVFTKSRVKGSPGITSVYKIPAIQGTHIAKKIGEYENCSQIDCWITSADITNDGKKVVLLSQKNILIFTDFKNDNFLSGNVREIELNNKSQKEGISFKDSQTIIITDEKSHGKGGNLYKLKLN